jgi:hypothetical protein
MDLAPSGSQVNRRLGLISQVLCMDRIGLQYMIAIYLIKSVIHFFNVPILSGHYNSHLFPCQIITIALAKLRLKRLQA